MTTPTQIRAVELRSWGRAIPAGPQARREMETGARASRRPANSGAARLKMSSAADGDILREPLLARRQRVPERMDGGLDARSQRRKHEKETFARMKERSLPSGGEPFQFEFGRIERTAGRREIGSFKFVPSRLGARFARICEIATRRSSWLAPKPRRDAIRRATARLQQSRLGRPPPRRTTLRSCARSAGGRNARGRWRLWLRPARTPSAPA